jgi:hypothetical protein
MFGRLKRHSFYFLLLMSPRRQPADRDLKDHLATSLRTVPYGWVSDPAVCPCPHSPG